MLETIQEIRGFFASTRPHTDRRIPAYLLSSIVLGCGMFLVEVLFVNALSVLVSHIGLNLSASNKLQFLTRFSFQEMIWTVVIIATARGLFQMLVYWLPNTIRQIYIQSFRKSLVPYVLYNPTKKKHSYLFAIYHDHLDKSASVYQMVPQIVSAAVAIALYSFYLFRLSTFFFVGGVTIFFVFMFPLKLMNRLFVSYSERLGSASDEQFALVHTGLKNFFFLSLYSKIETESTRARNIMDHVLRTFKRYYLFSGIRMNLPPFIGVAVVCFLIAWNGKMENPTPASVLVTFFYLFMKLANTLGELYGSLNAIPLSVDSTRKIKAVADEMNTLGGRYQTKQDSRTDAIPTASLQLRLSNASFSYLENSSVPAVGPIDLSVSKGQCITLKGHSGVGKSTVLGMLMGVYAPQSGQATLNGISLSEIRNQFSKLISYVGPEPYLIPGTLRENLIYCSEEWKLSDDQLWKALEQVGLQEFFRSKKSGLDERLSDLAELSTGQRQRISLARAFLRNTPILVLDEATANLDLGTERLILAHLHTIKPHCLLLISTHKNTFDDISDQIIEMKGNA